MASYSEQVNRRKPANDAVKNPSKRTKKEIEESINKDKLKRNTQTKPAPKPTPKPKPIAAVIAHNNERPYCANIPSMLIGSNILPPYL